MPNDQPTRRLRFTLKQLLLAVAVVGVGLWVWTWLFRKEVVVREAGPQDEVSERSFGFGDNALKVRNIAIASGKFARDTRLSVVLFLVQGGKIVGNGIGSDNGRASNEIGGPFWMDLEFRLALGENDVPGGHAVYLGTAGSSAEEGLGARLIRTFTAVDKRTLPGRITWGRRHIIYVEGDQKINVDGSMTLDDFANANSGNYLVMMVQVF